MLSGAMWRRADWLLLAGVSKEHDGLFRPRNGESSSHGDFGIYQATRRHTCEDRDVSVLTFRLEELKSSWFVSSGGWQQ